MNICLFPGSGLDGQDDIVRLIEPYGRLKAIRGFHAAFLSSRLSKRQAEELKSCDAIVIQRDLLPFLSAALCNLARERMIPVVYELDDLLIAPPKNHPARRHFFSKRPFLKWLLDRADGVTVSTGELARKLKLACRTHLVLPCCITRYPVAQVNTRRNPSRIRIGYAGMPSHEGDLDLVKSACFQIEREFKSNLEWCFYGCIPEWARRLPRVRAFPQQPDRKSFFQKWFDHPFDIGLAPLRDTEFNRVKDLTKMYDYSHMGAATVYSRVPPYAAGIRSDVDGLLAKNRTEDWVHSLRSLVLDHEKRIDLIRNSRKKVRKQHRDRARDLPRQLMDFYASLRIVQKNSSGAFGWVKPGGGETGSHDLAIYGTGQMADGLRLTLTRLGFNVAAYVESSPKTSRHHGLPVISPDGGRHPRLRMAIASFTYYAEIVDRLTALGYIYGRDFL